MCPSLSGATISIQETEISIVEETSGQICIVVENDDAELERDVSVTKTTTAGTAGKYHMATRKTSICRITNHHV